MAERHGLVLVHTGDGKGKTTAAMGLAVRAWGAGLRVHIIQFIKNRKATGEMKAIDVLAAADGRIAIEQCGRGFTRRGAGAQDKEAHRAAALAGLERAESIMKGGKADLLILDEINYAVKFGLVTIDEVLAVLDMRPSDMHVVLTGRDAAPEIVARADLVTEMKLIKHPYEQGIPAQLGIEF